MSQNSGGGSNAYGKRKQLTHGNALDHSEQTNTNKMFKQANVNTITVEKGFQKALKELGIRKQSAIQPNLNAAKTRDILHALNNEQAEENSKEKNGGSFTQHNMDVVTVESATEHDASAKSLASKENEPWISPKKNIKISLLEKIRNETQDSIKTQNKFTLLSSQNETNNFNTNSGKSEIKSSQSNKVTRPPPIYCSHSSAKTLINAISQTIDKKDFYLRDCKEKEQTIISSNIDTFKLIKEQLTKTNILFYTYTPASEKNKLLVLKGINDDFTPEETKEEIVNLNLPNIHVLKIEKLKVRDTCTQKNILLVHFKNDSVLKNITRINHLHNLKIKWEPYRKHKVYQCHNCQRFGHSSINCNLGFRCVKCNEDHNPGECKRSKESQYSPPYCVNCKETGHTANYRGCIYLKYAQDTINAAKAAITSKPHGHKKVQPNLTYAAVTHTQGNNQPTLNSPPHEFNTVPMGTDNLQHQITKSMESLLTNFKSEIINIICLQNAALQNQLNIQNEKIKLIFNKLELQRIE